MNEREEWEEFYNESADDFEAAANELNKYLKENERSERCFGMSCVWWAFCFFITFLLLYGCGYQTEDARQAKCFYPSFLTQRVERPYDLIMQGCKYLNPFETNVGIEFAGSSTQELKDNAMVRVPEIWQCGERRLIYGGMWDRSTVPFETASVVLGDGGR